MFAVHFVMVCLGHKIGSGSDTQHSTWRSVLFRPRTLCSEISGGGGAGGSLTIVSVDNGAKSSTTTYPSIKRARWRPHTDVPAWALVCEHHRSVFNMGIPDPWIGTHPIISGSGGCLSQPSPPIFDPTKSKGEHRTVIFWRIKPMARGILVFRKIAC